MVESEWIDIGPVDDFKRITLRAKRSVEMAQCLLEREMTHATIERGGRKASKR